MADESDYDVVIIGGGAAGLMCAITAGQRGRSVLVVDHNKYIGEKIRISGGGRCNFTNIASTPKNFLSDNPRFCISALKRYRPLKFVDLVNRHSIEWRDKGQGQLFCKDHATSIISMLLDECRKVKVRLVKETEVQLVEQASVGFSVSTSNGIFAASSLVIATGGLSIPKIGASSFGHTVAKQFGHTIIEARPGLVPLTFSGALLDKLQSMSGISADAVVHYGKQSFREALLFTHRGLSGPAILQISSYWRDGQPITIDLAPDMDMFEELSNARKDRGKQDINTVLAPFLTKRLADFVCKNANVSGRLADLNNKQMRKAADAVNRWQVLPQGSEGYRTAEVTLGGVNTKELSSKTMESSKVSNLYFIGEVVDVTGQLGGHNFQWAWASGHAAGQAV